MDHRLKETRLQAAAEREIQTNRESLTRLVWIGHDQWQGGSLVTPIGSMFKALDPSQPGRASAAESSRQ